MQRQQEGKRTHHEDSTENLDQMYDDSMCRAQNQIGEARQVVNGLFEDVKKLHLRIDPTFMAITEFTLYPNVPIYLKIDIVENTESPLILVIRASGGKKYDNVDVFGSFTQLKPSHETMDANSFYL